MANMMSIIKDNGGPKLLTKFLFGSFFAAAILSFRKYHNILLGLLKSSF